MRRQPIRRHASQPWGLLEDPKISEIASAHGRSPAQVVLRWHIQLGNVVIPKSVMRHRIEENFRIFDFELSDTEMEALAALDSRAAARSRPEDLWEIGFGSRNLSPSAPDIVR